MEVDGPKDGCVLLAVMEGKPESILTDGDGDSVVIVIDGSSEDGSFIVIMDGDKDGRGL